MAQAKGTNRTKPSATPVSRGWEELYDDEPAPMASPDRWTGAGLPAVTEERTHRQDGPKPAPAAALNGRRRRQAVLYVPEPDRPGDMARTMSHVQARGYEVQSITADAMTAVALLVSGAVAVVVAAEPISLLPGVELAWTDGIVGRESGRRPQRLRRWGPDGSNPPPSDDGRPRWIHATG